MTAEPAHIDPEVDPGLRFAAELEAELGGLPARDLLATVIERFPGAVAVSSSFGTESAVLLDMVAGIAPATPVIFLDTGMLFVETLLYRRLLEARLGLGNVRVIGPDPVLLATADPDGRLHETSPDSCCHLRKVRPMARALAGFDVWVTGRKRFHGGDRSRLPVFEWVDGRLKVNPLAGWSQADIERAFRDRDLPRHPLQAEGFTSVGCAVCTARPTSADDPRSGRWAGSEKTECGIHNAAWWPRTGTG